MDKFVKILLSLSASGTLLLCFVFGLKQLYKNKFSKQWQYYIWIIVISRFLLPFAPGTVNVGSLLAKLNVKATWEKGTDYNSLPVLPGGDSENREADKAAEYKETGEITENNPDKETMEIAKKKETEIIPVQKNETTTTSASPSEPFPMDSSDVHAADKAPHGTYPRNIYNALFSIWLVLALLLFVRKITIYQGFFQYMETGNTEVSDLEILNLLADCEEKYKIRKKVELYQNALAASPMMLGFFRPSIILPKGELDERKLSYIFAHELVHYRRRDMLYKWALQLLVCIHWFNPFVYLLEKEVNRACELSCDEAILSVLDPKAKREYGDTLIYFLKADQYNKNSFTSAALSGGAKQLKERLGAIMDFKKKSKTICFFTVVLTMCIVFWAAFSGIYPVSAETDVRLPETGKILVSAQKGGKTGTYIFDETLDYGWYLNGKNDKAENNNDKGNSHNNAQTVGENRNVESKTNLWDWDGDKDWDSEDEDWGWDDDGDWDWDWDDDDDWDWDWDDTALIKAYAAHGIEKTGKSYYYQGELVYLIKDQRPDSSFYMLDMNSEGTVSIRVVRDANGEITGVSYMSEDEIAKVLPKITEGMDEISCINTKEWDSSAHMSVDVAYETDQIFILPSPTDKIILKEYLTEDRLNPAENQLNYCATTEVKNNTLTIRSGDRPTENYRSYIEIYIPNAVLKNMKIETVSGGIGVEDYTGRVELSTVSGWIDVSGSDIAGNIGTVSGGIELFWVDALGDLDVSSHSGEIIVNFHDSVNCNLKAKTANGKIKGNCLGAKDKNKREFSKIFGNKPKTTLTLETMSSDIEINTKK